MARGRLLRMWLATRTPAQRARASFRHEAARRLLLAAAEPRVSDVSDRIAEDVEAKERQGDGGAGEEGRGDLEREVVARGAHVAPPRGRRLRHAKSQERE